VDGPVRRDAEDGPARQDAVDGPARQDAVDGPVRRDAGDGPARQDAGDGPARQDAGDGHARQDAGEAHSCQDAGDGPARRDVGGGPGPEPGGVCGLLLLDKPGGMTTNALVREAARILGVSKSGHAGTLDPMATGLVGALMGPAVKLSGLVMGLDKVYSGEMRLGLVTDTLDVTGKTLGEHPGPFPEAGEVREAFSGFLGTRPQRPPAFSAVKVGGRPSYKAARRGKAVAPLPERPATLHSFEILDWSPPVLKFRIEVASGFYVRSLANDLGEVLGLGGGSLQALRRETLGPFGLDRAARPPLERGLLLGALLSAREAVPSVPEYRATPDEVARIRHGIPLDGRTVTAGRLARLPDQPDWPEPRKGYPAGTVIVTLEGEYVCLSAFSGPGGPQGSGKSARQPAGDGDARAGTGVAVQAGPSGDGPDGTGGVALDGTEGAAKGWTGDVARDGAEGAAPAGTGVRDPGTEVFEPGGPFLRSLRVSRAAG
jgi:tRNA pseudouridine55 synthase